VYRAREVSRVDRKQKEKLKMTAGILQQGELTVALVGRWEQSSRKVAELAEVIPAEKFDSRPVAEIRSLSEALRHIAFWNQYVAGVLRGRNADDTGNELSPTAYASKASILEALKRTSADVATALREHHGPLDLKTTELIMTFVEHTSEHYGQLAVYARLMGIVPPASRT
jgi:uncharacterized damage-inducible protein DinB